MMGANDRRENENWSTGQNEDRLNVLVTYRRQILEEALLQQIRDASPQIRLIYSKDTEEDRALLPSADVLFCLWVPESISEARRLKWVQLLSAGYDQLQGSPLLDTDIIITTSSGIHATGVAEFVLGSMVALSRRFHEMLRTEDPEQLWKDFAFVGGELRGKTVGIIGYGSIGREVGHLARCFGMRVLGVDIRKDPWVTPPLQYIPEELKDIRAVDEDESLEIRSPQDLEWLLSRSDFVVLSLPLTPETRHLIGEGQLRAMKPGAYLINPARGALVDEGALLHALREGWIAGAALDVFEVEPLPADSPFYSLPNVILTPHMAGTTDPAWQRCVDVFCENLRLYLSGQPLLNQIHPPRKESRP